MSTVVTHTLNPVTWVAEQLSLVPGQPELYRGTLPQETKEDKNSRHSSKVLIHN